MDNKLESVSTLVPEHYLVVMDNNRAINNTLSFFKHHFHFSDNAVVIDRNQHQIRFGDGVIINFIAVHELDKARGLNIKGYFLDIHDPSVDVNFIEWFMKSRLRGRSA